MRIPLVRSLAALAILGAAAAVPVTAMASHPDAKKPCTTTKKTATHKLKTASAQPAITFGSYGGNMRPWTVSIGADGTVTGNSWVKPGKQHLVNPTDALNALFKLADAESFWSMAGLTSCTGTLPDIATQYIEISSTTGTKKVAVHGGCSVNFNQLNAALRNAAGLTQ